MKMKLVPWLQEARGRDVAAEIGVGLLLLLVIVAVIGWVTVALARRWIAGRLGALDTVMQRFEGGDHAARAAVSGDDEITRVETGFNRMAGALDARQREKDLLLEQLRNANDELQRGEERIRRAYDLQRVLNDLLRSSLGEQPLDAVLQRALDMVLGIPWLALEARGSVFIAEGEVLVMRAQSGLGPALLEICRRLDFGRCLCGRAAAELLLQDPEESQSTPWNAQGCRPPVRYRYHHRFSGHTMAAAGTRKNKG